MALIDLFIYLEGATLKSGDSSETECVALAQIAVTITSRHPERGGLKETAAKLQELGFFVFSPVPASVSAERL